MKGEIQAQLKALVLGAQPQFCARVEQDVAAIMQTGAKSFEDSFKILEDKNAGLQLRAAICWVLGRVEHTGAEEALFLALGSQEGEWRAEAARSLALIGSDLSVQPLISAMLTDQEVEVRDAAAYALGFCPGGTQNEQAVKALSSVVAAQNEMPIVRGTAAEALGNLGHMESTSVLIDSLQDASSEVRFWSAFALGQLGDARAIPALSQLAMTDNTTVPGWWSVRKEALDAITQIHELNADVAVC